MSLKPSRPAGFQRTSSSLPVPPLPLLLPPTLLPPLPFPSSLKLFSSSHYRSTITLEKVGLSVGHLPFPLPSATSCDGLFLSLSLRLFFSLPPFRSSIHHPRYQAVRKDVFCQVTDPVKHKGSGLSVQGYVSFCLVTKVLLPPSFRPYFSLNSCRAFSSSCVLFLLVEATSTCSLTSHLLQRADGKELRSVRRYRAFDWLRNQLRAEFPDILIPPLPEKTVLGPLKISFHLFPSLCPFITSSLPPFFLTWSRSLR